MPFIFYKKVLTINKLLKNGTPLTHIVTSGEEIHPSFIAAALTHYLSFICLSSKST